MYGMQSVTQLTT